MSNAVKQPDVRPADVLLVRALCQTTRLVCRSTPGCRYGPITSFEARENRSSKPLLIAQKISSIYPRTIGLVLCLPLILVPLKWLYGLFWVRGGVDLFAWEKFGADWINDALKQLKLEDTRVFMAAYGSLPDLSQWNPGRDIVFTWNGTTSGVCVPNGDWIPSGREGLTICDATSAAFAMDIPWSKLDVVTWSWQKVMGGEAAHGMIALSPRAVERLENYVPP